MPLRDLSLQRATPYPSHRRDKPANGPNQFFVGEARKAKACASCGSAVQGERTARIEEHATVSRRLGPVSHRPSVSSSDPDGGPTGRIAKRQEVTQLLPEGCRERLQPRLIDSSCLSHVSLDQSVVQQFGDRA